MEQVEDFLRDVKKQLDRFLVELSKKYSEPSNLYKPAWEFVLSGGKRLRPAIVFLASQTAGNDKNAIIPASAVELLHNFTLIHDDIMDRSDFRRKIPTVYKKYGLNQAILSGDVLMILAFEILKELPLQLRPLVFDKLAEASRIVCEGQQYDMDTDWKRVTLDTYLNIVSKKTASLLRYSAEIGVISTNPEDHLLRETLGNAMFYAGIAFQIIDDYIDLFSDQSGKTRGLDIKEKKPSAIIVAINSLDERHKIIAWESIEKFLKGIISVDQLIQVFTDLKIEQFVKTMAQNYITKAEQILDNIREKENLNLWYDLINILVDRKM